MRAQAILYKEPAVFGFWNPSTSATGGAREPEPEDEHSLRIGSYQIWAGRRRDRAGYEELLHWPERERRGGAVSKLGCAFASARGRGRRFRLVAAVREGKAATAASGAEGSPAGGGGLSGVSSRAAIRPPGPLALPWAPRPLSFSQERGPTRSPWADVRRGGGAGPPRTGRRGEGAPAESGPSAAPQCAAGRASPARGWGCILRGGRREAVRRGGGSRPPRGTPFSGGSAASPPRRHRGATSPGLAAREAPSRRRRGGVCAPEPPARVPREPGTRRGLPAAAPALLTLAAREGGRAPRCLPCGSSSLPRTSFRRCREVHDWQSGEKPQLAPSQTFTPLAPSSK